MAVYNGAGKGYFPYVIEHCPEYNGAPLDRANNVTLQPWMTDGSSAESFTFSQSSDYTANGNSSSYVDLNLVLPANLGWYTRVHGAAGISNNLNHPGDNSSGADAAQLMTGFRAFSIWMDVRVGTAPHPGYGYAKTCFAMLRNANGDHQGSQFYAAPGNTPNYSSPRTFCAGGERIKISGDNYGGGNYRGWACIASQHNASLQFNATTLRIINLGLHGQSRSQIQIQGLKILYHISPPNSDIYGSLSL